MRNRRRLIKWIAAVLAAALIVALAGFLIWTRAARYAALPEANDLVSQAADSSQGWLVFEPEQPSGDGLIIYPGGLVDPAAYAPLAQAFADRGVMTIIVPMPLDLAVLGVNSAGAVIEAYPEVERWAIAGHSLGGSMAAQFAASNAAQQSKLIGLALWAAYAPGGVDLSDSGLKVVSVFGSNDGVMKLRDEAELLKGLPDGTPLVVIEGGNHSGFGSYGEQQGDGEATIAQEEQRKQTVDATMQVFD